MPEKPTDKSRLIFGGFAGCVSKTAVAPLERIRIIHQTHTKSSLFETFKGVLRTEGWQGLWRGNFVACLRTFPSKSILFYANDRYKNSLFHEVRNKSVRSFLSGSFAGMTAMIFTYPLDLIRTRLSGTIFLTDQASGRGVSKSMTRTVTYLIKNEGLLAFYKGMTPSLIGAIPMEGIRFMSFGYYSRVLNSLFPGDDYFVLKKITSGGLAGLTAGILMFPNDTLRKNMQMNVKNDNNTIRESFVRLWNQGGIRRYFQGCLPYALRVAPSSAIQFGTYEYCKKHFLSKS